MRAARRTKAMRALAAAAIIGTVTLGAQRPPSALPAGECAGDRVVDVAPTDTSTELRLLLNVPAYRLDVIEHGTATRSIRVAVGQPQYRTPLGHFRIDYVVWNPWWRPPASAWARKERPQAPGWANPVGRAKLHVTGLVFLHGTPNEASLGTAASHACVRMANGDVIELARLVHRRAGPPTAPGLLDALIADTARMHTLTLSRTVPIDIVYVLAEVCDAALVLHPDVYRLAGTRVPRLEDQAMQRLRPIAGDTLTIDVARLRTLVRAARRSPVRLPMDSLLSKPLSVPHGRD